MRTPSEKNGVTQTLDSASVNGLYHSENSNINNNSANIKNNSDNINNDSDTINNDSDNINNNSAYINRRNDSDFGRHTGEVPNGQPRYDGLFNNQYSHCDSVAPTPAGVIAERPRSDMAELASVLAQAIRAGTRSTELPFYSGSYQEWLAFKASCRNSRRIQ